MAYRPTSDTSSARMSAGTVAGFSIRGPVNSLTQAAHGQRSRRDVFYATAREPSQPPRHRSVPVVQFPFG